MARPRSGPLSFSLMLGDLGVMAFRLPESEQHRGQRSRCPGRGGSGRKATVIVLHGTGGSKDGNRERETMARLAAKGIMAVAIDARYHGERVAGAKGAEAYNAAILAAWRAKPAEQEHPFYYDTVW